MRRARTSVRWTDVRAERHSPCEWPGATHAAQLHHRAARAGRERRRDRHVHDHRRRAAVLGARVALQLEAHEQDRTGPLHRVRPMASPRRTAWPRTSEPRAAASARPVHGLHDQPRSRAPGQVWGALQRHYSRAPHELRHMPTEGAVRASDTSNRGAWIERRCTSGQRAATEPRTAILIVVIHPARCGASAGPPARRPYPGHQQVEGACPITRPLASSSLSSVPPRGPPAWDNAPCRHRPLRQPPRAAGQAGALPPIDPGP